MREGEEGKATIPRLPAFACSDLDPKVNRVTVHDWSWFLYVCTGVVQTQTVSGGAGIGDRGPGMSASDARR